MTPRINTLFYWCNDIVAMRRFYSGILGLTETFFDQGAGWLTYDVNAVQLVFMRATHPLAGIDGWARQPGWREGTAEVPSLVLQCSLDEFRAVVARAEQARDVPMRPAGQEGTPETCLMHFLRDPMGNTVEVYFEKAGPSQP